ncbi:aspartate aminotransferase [Xaviernesmea oryzae]|uniref:aspartate transaminase n=1 Tax=Xaviernesmea oryzae TaxID=464029 RepID=A0A1Q9AR05_9HYPH|nr:aminotransferase class I/II-fold pyridoxal phosphate-dependent enzyme [Xaviernesmea oryzae]OLP57806.1 aspartate aminotransferase [Xaviernesmea oryzae]SEL36255.1 aspartate aminotransferase [Xaviernesmea oryzae]
MTYLAKRITSGSKKSYGMFAKALTVDGPGRDLIHMELGSPHADTPLAVKQATVDALMAGQVHYSHFQGIPALREALAKRLQEKNRLDVTANEIVVTNGLTHASYAAIMTVIDPGDEVILLEPYYPQHLGKIELAGGVPVFAPLDAINGFSINPDLIEAKITPRTKAIALVNPCNPTGRVYGRAELEGLAALAIRHDLVVLSDEVYEDILFDKAEHISIASLPGMGERTISMFAFTKSFAMDGWRIGYLAAPAAMIPGILKITTSDVTHVNTFIQAGALAAVTGPAEVLADLVAEDKAKRDLVVTRLNQMAGVTCAWPEGTIYAFPDITGTGIPAQTLAEMILDKAEVVVEAGSFYGQAGEGHLRVCFGSQSIERISEAMDRLQRFFGSL